MELIIRAWRCAGPQAPARRLWKTARHEASWDAVGSTYSLCWSAGSAVAPDPLTFVIESRSSVLTKAAKSPVAAGSAQDKSAVLIHDDDVIDDEVIDIVTASPLELRDSTCKTLPVALNW